MTKARATLIQNIDITATTEDPTTSDMIVLKGNSRITATTEEFEALYERNALLTQIEPSLARQGFKPYQSSKRVWAHQLTAAEITRSFPTQRFNSNTVAAGQFIVIPFPRGDNITVLSKAQFTKKISANNGDMSADNNILSQADAMQRWEATLRHESQIFSKISKIHAKVAIEDGVIETVARNSDIERHESYRKGDYIVCGSHNQKYHMEPHIFATRYEIKTPEPASDAKLAKTGFKLFNATGKVWAHKVSPEEVTTNFPAHQFFGKCESRVVHLILVRTTSNCANGLLSQGAGLWSWLAGL